MKNQGRSRFTLFIILAVSFVIFLMGCGTQDDVSFARKTIDLLIRGRYSARTMIDWPSLVVLGSSVAKEYEALPNDKEKLDYQMAFIDNFKKGFKSIKAAPKTFVHWRIFNNSSPTVTIVAADSAADKSYIFICYIKHEKGKRKLSEIRAMKINDSAKFQAYEQEQKNAAPDFSKK